MTFNILEIQASFRNLVGWEQPNDPSLLKLTRLTTTDSGIVMQGIHPLLTMENIQSTCPDFTLYTYPAYSNSTAYVVGDIVTNSGSQFYCILANTGQATSDTTYWKPWSAREAFTTWLEKQMDAVAANLLTDWDNKKNDNESAKTILERAQLYTATGDGEPVPFESGTVKMAGHSFRVTRSQSVRCHIKKVALHFTVAEPITLYLYKTGMREPVGSKVCNYTTANSVQWVDVDWKLKGEGAYFLCYKSDELTGSPYDDAHETSAWSAGYQMPLNGYVKAHPFLADITPVGGVSVDSIEDDLIVYDGEDNVAGHFNPSKAQYNLATNGLNVQFYVGCDFTDLFIEQRLNFARPYSLLLAVHLMETIMNNPSARNNRNESSGLLQKLAYALGNVKETASSGLRASYEKSLAAMTFDKSGIDNVCLPCAQRGKLRIVAT